MDEYKEGCGMGLRVVHGHWAKVLFVLIINFIME
jgi:hypothetical protein